MTSKNIFKNFLSFSSVQGLSSIGGMIYSFFIAKFLGPEILGIVRTAQLSENYSELSSLGLPFALRREIPQLLGDKQEDEVVRMSNAVYSYGLIAYAISSLVVLCVSFFIENRLLSYSLAIFSIVIFLKAFNSFGNIMAKGLNDYKFLSKMELLKPIILILSLPLVYFFGISAVLWINVLIALILSIFYYKYIQYGYHWYWNWNIIRKLLFVAFPIFLTSISTLIFSSIDRLVIATFGSFEEVGFYTVGNMIATPIFIIISTSSLVIFTGLNKKYGKQTNESIILKHIEEPIILLSYLIPLFIGVGVIFMPSFIQLFLPKYYDAVIIGQILAVSVYFQVSSSFAANAMFVMEKQKQTSYLFFVVGLINTLLGVFTMIAGWGIIGVAYASLIAYLVYNTLLISMVFYNLNWTFVSIVKRVIKNQSPFLVQIFILWLIYHFIIDNNSLSLILLSFFLFVLTTSFFWIKGIKKIIFKLKTA